MLRLVLAFVEGRLALEEHTFEVAANDAKVAEIGAVKVALARSSLVVFSWCVNKVMRPWALQAIFADIENDMLKAGTVVFSLVDKNGNEMVFSLVMASVNRAQMFKAWW
ncbi:hypothetical protein PVK06_006596 [Gossypium arboreum]|uniref:Uncharacterized protein n=1 Tax=Gossypium arboreum TaxID=29729 RepID=A0ABR0QF50_GOSAR|nr:hypothetical protein PVK06_006596 [Gossypium arboreum]